MVISATTEELNPCSHPGTLDDPLVGDQGTSVDLHKAQMRVLEAGLPVGTTTPPQLPTQQALSLRKTAPLSRSAYTRSTIRSPISVASEAGPSNHAPMQPVPRMTQENGKAMVSYCSSRYLVLSVLSVHNHRPIP